MKIWIENTEKIEMCQLCDKMRNKAQFSSQCGKILEKGVSVIGGLK